MCPAIHVWTNGLSISGISQRLASGARTVRDYTRPRPTTAGDLPVSSSASAALAGTFQGWLSGGVVIAGAGLLGGYVGVKVGEKTQNFIPAIGAGALTGAAVATTATAALSALMSAPIAAGTLAAGALLGGFAGAVGTLSGSRRASTRDGVYGGMVLGLIGRAATGNPLFGIAAAAGGGIGGKAPTVAGRLVLGAVGGALTGAISGVLGGPHAMLSSALAGAALGAGGAVLGPVARQVQRNVTEDVTASLIGRIDPYIKKHGVSRGQKIALGATAGVLTIGPLGLLFGLKGMAVAAGIGATVGAVSTWRALHKRDQAKRAEQAQAGQPTSPPSSAPASASPSVAAPETPVERQAQPGDAIYVPRQFDPQSSMYVPVAGDRVPDVHRMSPEEIAAAWSARRLPPVPVAKVETPVGGPS